MSEERPSGTRRTVLKGLGAAAGGTALGVGATGVASAADVEWVHEDVRQKYEKFAPDEAKPDMYYSTGEGVGRIGASVHRTLSLVDYNINTDPTIPTSKDRSYEFGFSFSSFGAGLWRQWDNLSTSDPDLGPEEQVPSLFAPNHVMKAEIQNVAQDDYFRSDGGASLSALRNLTDNLSVSDTSESDWVTDEDLSSVDTSNYEFGGKYVSGLGLAIGVGSTIATGGFATVLTGAGLLLSAATTAETLDREEHGVSVEESDQQYRKEWEAQSAFPGFLCSIYFQVEIPKGESWTLEVIDEYTTDDPVYVQQADTSDVDDMLRNQESELILVDIPPNYTDDRDYVDLPEVI
ncbi:MAG: hypothetical protein ABEI75_01000 [Halobaculum sp.]